MWSLGRKANQSNKLPSECVPGLDEIVCDWTIYQFDNAIQFFVAVIESALQEREKVGDESRPVYSISQLLADDFRLLTEKQKRKQVGATLKSMFGARSKPQQQDKGKPKSMIPESLAKQLRARGILQ